jgi:hypothetical protein
MTKAGGRQPKNDLPPLSKCGIRPAALPITGACRHDIASCRVAHIQVRSATIWLAPKSQAATLNEQFNVWQLQRVKQQLGIQQAGGFLSSIR